MTTPVDGQAVCATTEDPDERTYVHVDPPCPPRPPEPAVCFTCWTELPVTGICGVCG